jgi:hypothetical protein
MGIAMRNLTCALLFSLVSLVPSAAQNKYSGPRPPQQDLPYLLHAGNLVATEASEAKEERRKDDIANIVEGAASPARTPLAEPIFLLATGKLQAEKMELYQMEVRNGRREVVVPTTGKRRKDAPRPLRLAVERLEPGLYRLEASQGLENGEYCLTPAGSQVVFCFQVY